MCAIVDVNVSYEVFGDQSTQRLARGSSKDSTLALFTLVVSRKLLAELNYGNAQQWIQQAILAGKVRQEATDTVDEREKELNEEGRCHSNDTHVIALAQITGARLLYSNDKDLHEDFGNKRLIDRPRGKVYSTNERKDFTSVHARLLNNLNLCRNR